MNGTGNGSVKFAGIFVTLALASIGIIIGAYTWATANFTSRGEFTLICGQLSDIRADMREVKFTIAEISRVVNSH